MPAECELASGDVYILGNFSCTERVWLFYFFYCFCFYSIYGEGRCVCCCCCCCCGGGGGFVAVVVVVAAAVVVVVIVVLLLLLFYGGGGGEVCFLDVIKNMFYIEAYFTEHLS